MDQNDNKLYYFYVKMSIKFCEINFNRLNRTDEQLEPDDWMKANIFLFPNKKDPNQSIPVLSLGRILLCLYELYHKKRTFVVMLTQDPLYNMVHCSTVFDITGFRKN